MPRNTTKKSQTKSLKTVKEKLKELEACSIDDKKTRDLENSRMALMNILEDVEEARKKAEEEKEKTASIVRNLSDGLIVLDDKGKISLLNPQSEKILEIPQKEMVGKKIGDFEGVERMNPLFKLFKKELKSIFRKEIFIDKELILEVSTVPMIISGTEFGTIIILHDITREKTVERMKTEFVSLAAHQLRTPLSAIKWTIKMLLEGDAGEINESQRDLIEKSYQSNERMIGLINDLLDITRIEEGRYLYNPTLDDLINVTESVVKASQDTIKKKGVKFEFKKPPKRIPRVMMDTEKIRLVIQNLLENAIRYTPSGGKVTISIKSDKNKIEFQIGDTGVGIPKEQQLKIFSKFFRGSNVTKLETEGSGLGLFIAKNIIEAHGGKIWFESEEEKGSVFHFLLPVKKELEEFLKEF